MDIEDLPEKIRIIHDNACKENKDTYIDPESGFVVFTEISHQKRGKCCGKKCRHCPYSWENVRK